MNITTCPHCGGRVRSVSIGWKCESCKGFIDMRGQFHEHKEEPFMPSMTNADRIRAMRDEELAEFLAEEQFRIENVVFQTVGYGLEKQAIYARRLDWLQQLYEGE